MKTNPTLSALLAITVAAPFAASAQSEAPDPERVKAAIATVENHIETREHRATELTNDIISMDQRIEKRIDRIIEMLEGITDSTESQIRVSQLKQRAIDGLKKTIEYYDQKRRTLKTETMERDPQVTRDTLFGDIGKFDDRIEKRVEQILDLSKSMQTHKDYEKWRNAGTGYWGTYRERNPKYYQNRKEVRHTEGTREQLMGELDQSIERYDRRNREIEETLKKKITDQYREMLTTELNHNKELIGAREFQKEDLAVAQDPKVDPVGRDQALNIEHMIDDMAEDLNRDFFSMFAIYAELNEERAAIKALRDQLGKYEAMLK